MQPGRLTLRISNALRKALQETDTLGFKHLAGIDLQPQFPLAGLLRHPYRVEIRQHTVTIYIEVDRGTVKQQNQLATHFYFDLILVSGDAGRDGSLQTDHVSSPLFSFEPPRQTCILTRNLPPVPQHWMALLKVNCLESNELASHCKHDAMKVVASG